MNGHLEQVREQLHAGTVRGQTLVELFAAVSEAEQRRDLATLEEALGLAQRIAAVAAGVLEGEAERLVELCGHALARARGLEVAGEAAPAAGTIACPGCGRELPQSAVRCRTCGYLLV